MSGPGPRDNSHQLTETATIKLINRMRCAALQAIQDTTLIKPCDIMRPMGTNRRAGTFSRL